MQPAVPCHYLRPDVLLKGQERPPLTIQSFNLLASIPDFQRTDEEKHLFHEECQRRNVIGICEHYERVGHIASVVGVVAACVFLGGRMWGAF